MPAPSLAGFIISIVKLTYPITFEDYCALVPPFTARAGHNAGFKAVLAVCLLMAGIGVYGVVNGFGIYFGVFFVCFALVAAICAYLFEKWSVSKAKKKYETNLTLGYQQTHCRDQRMFEVNENGFTTSCACGALTRPWSELVQFSENEKFFQLGTKTARYILPKSAFSSEAAITEFRALISERLNVGRLVTSRHFEFASTPADYRRARSLHIRQGGGWRSLLKGLFTLVVGTWGFVFLWKTIAPLHQPAILSGLAGGALLSLWRTGARVWKVRSARYFGPLQISFNEDSLYFQTPRGQLRKAWADFIGYLEDDQMLLLYSAPRLYQMVPKRALTGSGAEFRGLVGARIRRYNYRQPIPIRSERPSNLSPNVS
jgi:hypothetical protein